MMFKEIDTRGEDELNYEELRNGLANFQVYLSKVEFKNIMECIDPDMNGSIHCARHPTLLGLQPPLQGPPLTSEPLAQARSGWIS